MSASFADRLGGADTGGYHEEFNSRAWLRAYRRIASRRTDICPVAAGSGPKRRPLTVGAPRAPSLRTGTEVPLLMAEDLTTKGKKLRVGQRIHFVAEDVKLNGGLSFRPVAPRWVS